MIDQTAEKLLGDAYKPMRGFMYTGGRHFAIANDPDVFCDQVDNELVLLSRFSDLVRL